MLLVKTYVAPSPIHGIGLFAGEDLPKGTIVWMLDKEFDIIIDPKLLESYNPIYRDFILKFGYLSTYSGNIILCMDNGRFINHSNNPSLLEEPYLDDGIDVAALDIEKGSELTSDYSKSDKWWRDKIKQF